MIDDLKCKGCEAGGVPLIIFVGTIKRNDKIEELEEGYHPYCKPCRDMLGISDELNAGRDLRSESKQVTLDAVEEARNVDQGDSNRDQGISIIMDKVGDWVGGTDGIMQMLGKRSPARPQSVFDGVSDAMGEIEPATMTPTQALGLITITNTTKSRIENWQSFVARTHDHFKTIMSEEKARGNLVGFI